MPLVDKLCVPSKKEFLEAIKLYEKVEKRDADYKAAESQVTEAWGNAAGMAHVIKIFLDSWMRTFYGRFGAFDIHQLEAVLQKNLLLLESFRKREILSIVAGGIICG